MAIPDEGTLSAALKVIRVAEPTLARGKVLKKLKEEDNWEYDLMPSSNYGDILANSGD